ncbi:MAG: hypothetical protein HYZ09_03505 [Candidatus Kerfeldbacteria bacterium]|nr:hypothetical protein [Candidatus Kerfeldbacteria bacterium]
MSDKPIGQVTHYFPKVGVAVVKLTAGLKVGDTVKLVGHGAEFEQTVTSMQVDHEPVEKGKKGHEVAIKVDQPVHEKAELFKA